MRINEKSLFQKFGCGILLLDAGGRFSFANSRAEEILGVPEAELVGILHEEAPFLLLTEEGHSLPEEEDPWKRVFLNAETIQGEHYCVMRSDGEHRAISLNGTALRDQKEKITGAAFDFTDTTQKAHMEERMRRSEHKLRQKEARLRSLVHSLDEIVLELDADGSYLNVYAENESLLKLPGEELLGRRVEEVLEKSAAEKVMQALRRVQETQTPQSVEYCLEVLGGWRCFLARIAPIPPCEGRPGSFSFLARDISERRRVEEELRASQRRFYQILDAVQLTALLLSPEGEILYCNDYFLHLGGWRREEVMGRNALDTFLPPDIQEEVRSMWQTFLASGESSNYNENEILTLGGERRLLAWNNIVIRNEDGSPKFCASIAVDITEQRVAEELLRSSNAMKSEFISIAAHELRTPLTTIMGYAELLMSPDQFGGFSPEQQREFLQEIQDKGEFLAKMVDELLDLSRLESGKPIPLVFEPCSLDSLLGKIVQNFRVHHPKHHFELQQHDPCPRDVLMDRGKMEQVMENLLSNAVKYSPPGSHIRIFRELSEGGYKVRVEDDGIGMTPEQVSHIFDKFYRADTSDTATSGLGLGMSIVKGIIEGHGGGIEVESALGRGTTVTFTLPRGNHTPQAEISAPQPS